MVDDDSEQDGENAHIIKEIIGLEREYYFEKRNVKTERQRKLREIIERHTRPGGDSDDS
jgi:hypothetical protein